MGMIVEALVEGAAVVSLGVGSGEGAGVATVDESLGAVGTVGEGVAEGHAPSTNPPITIATAKTALITDLHETLSFL